MKGYDPNKHETEVRKGITDLGDLIKNIDTKIEKAKTTQDTKDKAAAAAKAKTEELVADKALLVGRLEQANSVLARITGEDTPAVAPVEDELPV